uniref:Peptidase M23B n=1 Tax=uncultured marine virus TaxID=186617 RepID=A0A0F7LBZ5_9VIRU|nr:peptidase M23B [uncultured marine virus]
MIEIKCQTPAMIGSSGFCRPAGPRILVKLLLFIKASICTGYDQWFIEFDLISSGQFYQFVCIICAGSSFNKS